MLKVLFLSSIVALTTGCAAAKLSRGPDTYALTRYPDAVRIGVAKVLDERGGHKVGTIGATVIFVKKELADLTTNYLIHHLNSNLRANVEQVIVTSPDEIPSEAAKNNVEGIVLARINRLRMFSIDALMQPVEVELSLDVEVYDRNGLRVYKESFMGHHEKRIGITLVEHSTGKLVEAAVLDAMNNLVKDPGFKKSIASLRPV